MVFVSFPHSHANNSHQKPFGPWLCWCGQGLHSFWVILPQWSGQITFVLLMWSIIFWCLHSRRPLLWLVRKFQWLEYLRLPVQKQGLQYTAQWLLLSALRMWLNFITAVAHNRSLRSVHSLSAHILIYHFQLFDDHTWTSALYVYIAMEMPHPAATKYIYMICCISKFLSLCMMHT